MVWTAGASPAWLKRQAVWTLKHRMPARAPAVQMCIDARRGSAY